MYQFIHSSPARLRLPPLKVCTYVWWFARPAGLRQPLSARCMRTLLRFRMGNHSFLPVLGWRTGFPQAQR